VASVAATVLVYLVTDDALIFVLGGSMFVVIPLVLAFYTGFG
jgi:hypothetical protein